MSVIQSRRPAEPAEPPTASEPAVANLADRWLSSVPELLSVAVAAISLPAMALLLAGRFSPPLALAAGGVAAAGAIALLGPERLLPGFLEIGHGRPDRPGWRSRLPVLLVLAIAVLAMLYNARYSSQDLYAVRDPGTYVVTGQWLSHHQSLPVDAQPEVFGQGRQPESPLYWRSAGFGPDVSRPGYVYPQGNHLLPVLLALGGWLGGLSLLLKVNALIGALALVAMFGLLRRFTGSAAAVVAVAALAVSMPMLAFTRDAYTEPLALLLLFGGLSVLCRAIRSGRATEFALAGLTIGCSVLDRVDGYAPLLAVLGVAAVYAARVRPGRGRKAAALRVLLLVACGAVPALAGFWDVAWLSSGYYRDVRYQVVPLMTLTAVVAVLGAVVVAVVWRFDGVRRLAAARTRDRLGAAGAVLVVLFFIVLTTRPLWQTAREAVPEGRICNGFVPQVQAVLGQPIELCRSYDELTLHWLAWYYGWPAVAAAVVGLALLVRRTARTLQPVLVGTVGMTLALCVLYLVRSSITPDQIWAMRRYLPVIIPGLLGAAGWLTAVLWSAPWWRRALSAGLGAALVVVPAVITDPMGSVRQYVPQRTQVELVCAELPADGAVLVIGKGMADAYLMTVRAACDVPAVGVDDPTAAQLSRIRSAAVEHGRTLYVITQDHAQVPWTTGPKDVPSTFYTAQEQRWPTRLTDVPQQPESAEIPLWMGLVLSNGKVAPLAP